MSRHYLQPDLMETQHLGNNVNAEVYTAGIVLRTWGGHPAIYLDEQMIGRLFVHAVRHGLIDAQQIMAEVYDN
jgi:hypothetical protein